MGELLLLFVIPTFSRVVITSRDLDEEFAERKIVTYAILPTTLVIPGKGKRNQMRLFKEKLNDKAVHHIHM